MAKFELNIDSENDIFADAESAKEEIARILEAVAEDIRVGGQGHKLFDANGNKCGAWDYEGPEEAEEEADTNFEQSSFGE